MGKSKRKSPNKKQIKNSRKKSVSKRPRKSVSKRPRKSVSKRPRKSVSKRPKKSVSKRPRKSVSKRPKKSVSKRPRKSVSKRPKKSRRYRKRTSSSALDEDDEKCVFTYTDDTDTEYIIFTHKNKKHRLKNMPNIKNASLELITDEEARSYLMNGKNKNISKGDSTHIINVNKKLKSAQDYYNSQEVRMSPENEPVFSTANIFAKRKNSVRVKRVNL
jgi:hypothetical protein